MLTSIVPTVNNILKICCYNQNNGIDTGQNKDFNVGIGLFGVSTDGFLKDRLSGTHIDSFKS